MDRTDTPHSGPTHAAGTAPQVLPFEPERARIPALASHTARQSRLAVDERLRAMLSHTFGISSWTVGPRSSIDPMHALLLRLRWGMQSASVTLDLMQHPGLASLVRSPDAGTETGAQAGLRTAVASILLAPLLQGFAQLDMDGVEVVSAQAAAPGHVDPERCAIAFQIGMRRFDLVLEQVDDGWLDAFERIVAQQCLPFATHVSEIAVPGRLLIGERAIDITTLGSLQPGDVILRAVSPDVRAFFTRLTPSVTLPLVWGRYGIRQLRARVALEADTLTLTEDPRMSHDTHFSAPLTDSVDTPVEISNLDLPLKFEIDTVSLPVAQLSALRTGYVLELQTSALDARIRLVSYGQTIGFGELVSVGEHLGVRLVQLSHSHGSV
jgi:type III secretion protein Q